MMVTRVVHSSRRGAKVVTSLRSEDQSVWTFLLSRVRLFLEDVKRDIEQSLLNLECTKASIKVYEQFGKRHPAQFGASSSVKSQEEYLEVLRTSEEHWQKAVQLIEQQMTDECKHISVGGTDDAREESE